MSKSLSNVDFCAEFKKAMPRASAALLKRLIRNLYDVVFMNEGRLEGFYVTASANAASIQSSQMKKASGVLPEAFSSFFQKPILQSSTAKWQFIGPKVAYWPEWWRISEIPGNLLLHICFLPVEKFIDILGC